MQNDKLIGLLKTGTFQAAAVLAAAEGDKLLPVHHSDHEEYRYWVIPASFGSVTIWDTGNGWCHVESVHTTDGDESSFWNRLGRYITEHPNQRLMHGLEVKEVLDLMSPAAA